jgi:hypothetical protein
MCSAYADYTGNIAVQQGRPQAGGHQPRTRIPHVIVLQHAAPATTSFSASAAITSPFFQHDTCTSTSTQHHQEA